MGIQISSVQLSRLVMSASLQLFLGTVGIKKLKIKTYIAIRNLVKKIGCGREKVTFLSKRHFNLKAYSRVIKVIKMQAAVPSLKNNFTITCF